MKERMAVVELPALVNFAISVLKKMHALFASGSLRFLRRVQTVILRFHGTQCTTFHVG
jgi:hypothetical protein